MRRLGEAMSECALCGDTGRLRSVVVGLSHQREICAACASRIFEEVAKLLHVEIRTREWMKL